MLCWVGSTIAVYLIYSCNYLKEPSRSNFWRHCCLAQLQTILQIETILFDILSTFIIRRTPHIYSYFHYCYCKLLTTTLYIKSESTEFYCEQKCKSAAAIAKSQSGIAFKSITDPPSSFSSLKMTETC